MTQRTRYRTANTRKRANTWPWAWIGLLALGSLVACSPAEPSLEREPTATARSGTAVDRGTPKATEPRPTNTPSAPFAPTVQAMIERTQADLAQRLGLETSQISVVEAKAVEWRDSSLGCPQPGLMYAQMITPGYKVVLTAGDQEYEYHTDQGQNVVECEGQPGALQAPAGNPSLPIYLQVVQTLLMPGAPSTATLVDPPPNSVFAFDSTSRTLLLRPSVSLSPDAWVLVGLTMVIQETDQHQVRGELYQVPPDQEGPIELLAVDAQSGALTVSHAGQTFELQPGESRSFKRAAGNATEITVVTHTGRLVSVDPFVDIPGGR